VIGVMEESALGTGKLPVQFLQTLLERYGGKDERMIVGPRVGEDAVVLDMGDRYLVAKTDPITFATDEIGWYVVHVNANDVAAMGARPRWLLLTLLLPEEGTDREKVDEIFSQVHQACQSLGIVLCGGHTEVTYGLDRPVAVGFMLAEMEKGDLVRTDGALVGDHLILTKGIAIEGTAVLALELGDRLAEQVDPELVARGRRFLKDPGISVVRDAQIVCRAGRPHAMHDPTEGGLATGLWELAQATGKGLVVDLAKIHHFPETIAFCQALGLDPLGVLASGALLVASAPEESAQMVEALEADGTGAAVIGQIVGGAPLVHTNTPEGLVRLPSFQRDELLRVLA
jgi:hydrogenase expression/formation protein HypE